MGIWPSSLVLEAVAAAVLDSGREWCAAIAFVVVFVPEFVAEVTKVAERTRSSAVMALASVYDTLLVGA